MIVSKKQKTTPLFHSLLLILFSFNMPAFAKAADITTTLPPLAGLIHLLKPDANVACLLPANADPHHFQLSPHQVEELQQTKLLVRSSQDDGHWTSLHSQSHVFDLWPRTKHTHHDEPTTHHDEPTTHHDEPTTHHDEPITNHDDPITNHDDPITNHAWLNPHAVQAVLPKLAAQLQTLYPEDKQAIQKNLTLALTKAEQLWQAWLQTSQAAGLNDHGVIMQHPAWTNLFQALNIPIFNSLESEQHGHEHGPRKLESALEQLQQHPGIRLIADSNHSNRSLQWLKNHHQSSIITTLDALGSCDESWTHLMRRNLDDFQP